MNKLFLCIILSVTLLAGTALAIEFSAETIFTHGGGAKTSGMVYYKADRFRMDMKSPEEMIVITRIDKKVVWNIMPVEKMYMEIPFDLKNQPMVEEKLQGEIERKQVGTETINGHPTKKYLITYKSGNKTDKLYQWWATDINFPIKSSAVDGSWSQEYRNIKIGSQPNSLFEVPSGYNKFDMPGGMNFMNR